MQLMRIDPPLVECNLFEARDHQSLPILNRRNVVARFQKTRLGSGIEPAIPRPKFSLQLPTLQIREVYVRDFQFAARSALIAGKPA